MDNHLLHQLIAASAARTPDAPALSAQGTTLTYADLAGRVERFAGAVAAVGLARSERLAVYLDKRVEFVVSVFGAAAAGGVFVPVNPLLKSDQVAYILADCNVRMLVTSRDRYEGLVDALSGCPDLHTVVLVDDADDLDTLPGRPWQVIGWEPLLAEHGRVARVVDTT